MPAPERIAADAARVTDAREIIVISERAGSVEQLLTRAAPLGYQPVAEIPADALGLKVAVLQMPDDRSGPRAIGELEALVPGILAGVNHAYDFRNEAGDISGRQYANQFLDWPSEGCVAQRPIGIIDAAWEQDRSNVAAYRRFFRGRAAEDQHGWDVAALIDDPTRLRSAQIFMADVVGKSRRGKEEASVDAIVAALSWLYEQDVRLVNISLAGPYNKILDHAIANAAERGMVIVASVGNEGPDGAPLYPAAFPEVLGVTAVDADGALYQKAIRGEHVAVAAPGVDINLGTRYLSGTSYSAAFVTAFLAASPGALENWQDANRQIRRHAARDGAAADEFGFGVLDLKGGCG